MARRSMVGRSGRKGPGGGIRIGLRPGGAVGASEDRALGDQLRLGLLDEGILVDAKEDGADPGECGDEEEGEEQEGTQPQRRPVALGELLGGSDQAGACPRQRPIR